MCVVHRGLRAVIARAPFAVRQVQLAVHAVHSEGQVEVVSVRYTEQVVGGYVEITVVTVPHTGIPGQCLGLRFPARKDLQGAGGNLFCRNEGNVIFHLSLACDKRTNLWQHVYLRGVCDVRIVLLFHNDRPGHGGISDLCPGPGIQAEGRQCRPGEDIS